MDEAEAVHRRELQQVPVYNLARRGHAAEPVEVRVRAGLRDIRSVHQKHRMIVHGLIQERPLRLPAVQRPANNAIRGGVAVDMRRYAVAILGDDIRELDIEKSEQATIPRLAGLLVGIDLSPEQKAERCGVIAPWVKIRGGGDMDYTYGHGQTRQ